MAMGPSEVLAKSRKISRTAATLEARDWRLVFRAWCSLLRTSLALRVQPALAESKRMASIDGEWNRDGSAARNIIARLERAVRVASHAFPRRPRCLVRSLVLGRLLAERGVPTRHRIGVRHEGGQLEAHAWLEFQGRPVGEPEDIDRRFAPLEAGSPDS